MPTSNPCYDLILLYGYCYLFMEGQLPKPGAVQKFDYHFLGSDAPRSCRDETYLMGYATLTPIEQICKIMASLKI
mgnify:CR=1 FL=1